MVSSTACVPSDLFSHVYHYLVSNGFTKSAKYFKKETSIDPVTPAGPDLVEIFNSYFQDKKTKEVTQEVEKEESPPEKTEKVEKKKKKKRKAEDENEESKDAKKLKVESEEKKEEEEKAPKKADKKSKKGKYFLVSQNKIKC